MISRLGVNHIQAPNANTTNARGICTHIGIGHTASKSRIVQIVLVIPAAIPGVIRMAEFTLTKLYHATQSAKQAL